MEGREGNPEVRGSESETLAWVLVIVLGALALAAGFALARPLGRLIEPKQLEVWPYASVRNLFLPEPTELARFAIAAVTPLIAALTLVFAGERATGLLEPRFSRALPAVGTLIVLSVVAVGWLARSEPYSFGLNPDYFGDRDLAGALLVATAILLVALRRPD